MDKMAKGVIGNNEKPPIPAYMQNGFGGRMRITPGIIEPMNHVGATCGPG
jgi:hypothetical protein